MIFLLGFAVGLITFYLGLIVNKLLKQKVGVRNKDYRGLPFTSKLRDEIRHIIFEYDIKKKNADFLLNILLNGEKVMQIMHRSHFPELCKDESDIEFGLALFIPVKDWPVERAERLRMIMEEESEFMRSSPPGDLEYQVIDLGRRIRFGGYLLTRILKEVFDGNEEQFSSSLFSEGDLPYWRN